MYAPIPQAKIETPAEMYVARLSSFEGLSPIFLRDAQIKPIKQPKRPPPAITIGKM